MTIKKKIYKICEKDKIETEMKKYNIIRKYFLILQINLKYFYISQF